MTKLHHTIVINAPVEKVWRVLADLEQVQYYNPLVSKTHYISSNKSGVGASRYCSFIPNGYSKERVTAWEPNKSLTIEMYESAWPMQFTHWTTYLKPNGKSTIVSQDMEYELKFGPLGQLMDFIMIRRRFNQILNDIFNGLKAYIETGENQQLKNS